MGRPPCCDNIGLKKGPWTPEEDEKLVVCIQKNGHHRSWKSFPKLAGLNRCGKSCRLRWNNYLRPDIKRGKFTEEEQHLIISLHSLHGNKWAKIASHLAGRTDNEIKNYWNTSLKKKLQSMGIDPVTHRPRMDLKLLATLPHLLNTAAANFSNSTNQWGENGALKAQADHAAQLLNMKLFCDLLQVFKMMPSNQMLGTYNPLGLAPFQNQLLGSTMQPNDCHLNGHLVDHHHQNIFSPPGSDFLNVGIMQPSDAYQSSADSLNNYQAPIQSNMAYIDYIENHYLNDSNNAGTGNSVSASPECSSVRETELDMEVKSYNIPRSESWEELLGDEFTDFSWRDLLNQTCELERVQNVD